MKCPRQSGRQQERTDLTRTRLMQSAERIFARDGFEAAKLEEIAADAGYTRGALYANFENKEDLFFALLENEIAQRIENVRSEMVKVRDPGAKLQALRKFFLDKSADRQWSLLALELKLFAVRHPKIKARLAMMNRRFVSARRRILQEIMEGLQRQLAVPANVAAVALTALSNVLTLEQMLDRTAMSQRDAKTILGSLFDSLTGQTENSAKKPAQK
jgi:AcrR family transcriptional regulator